MVSECLDRLSLLRKVASCLAFIPCTVLLKSPFASNTFICIFNGSCRLQLLKLKQNTVDVCMCSACVLRAIAFTRSVLSKINIHVSYFVRFFSEDVLVNENNSAFQHRSCTSSTNRNRR